MAYSYYVNQTISSGSEGFYRIKEILKTAGWSVTSSGDGLSAYSNSSDVITGFASGANGMANTRAWFIATHPTLDGYQRSICVQATALTVRVKVSVNGFVGGSPSSTVVPSATDEILLFGSGTDASPTLATFFDAAANVRLNLIAGGSSEGYSFYMCGMRITTGGLGGLILMEKLTDTNALDIDPYIYYMQGGSSYPTSALNNLTSHDWVTEGSSPPYCYVRKGYSNFSISKVYVSWFGTHSGSASNQMIGTAGTDPYDGADIHFPVMIFVTSNTTTGIAVTHYKGKAANIKLAGTARTSLDTTAAKTQVYAGPFVFPWNGSTPSV